MKNNYDMTNLDAFDELALALAKSFKENKVITIDEARERVETMNKEKRAKILEQHKDKIWQGEGTDKRWKTHLPDRRLLRKQTREELEDALVAYYEKMDKGNKPTLRTTYPKWLKHKKKTSPETNNLRRIHADWKRFYENDPIVDIPIEDLTYLQLKEWAADVVKKNHLKKKCFNNMQTIMKHTLEYAIELNIIEKSPYQNVKVKGNLFANDDKKPSEKEVFLTDEEPLVCQAAYQYFEETGDAFALSIPLFFKTGLRVGEMVALKEDDIKDGYIYIRNMERVYNDLNIDEPTVQFDAPKREVVDRTKTLAGKRSFFLVPEAIEIIEKIKASNKANGFYDNGYLFVNKDGRATSRKLSRRHQTICKRAGVEPKSLHKIRKTFISTLIDADVNISLIREVVGHKSEITTYKNYCFNTHTKDESENILTEALSGAKSSKKIS